MRHALLALLAFAPALRAAPPDFDEAVAPLLKAHCVRCHGGEKTRGGLDARSKAGLLDGGDGGAAVVPGSPEKSLLWIHVAADKMPPDKAKLTAAQKALLREWIEGGASGGTGPAPPPPVLVSDKDRDFWSLKPPRRPATPRADDARSPIDAFVLAALRRESLDLSPEADRRTLARRLSFGLTGLPPTPEEVAAFVDDPSPDAYERLVDRLLASPAYGERWGRHWLDVAGYADSEGILDADYVRAAAWRYRDYVVRALNADKPYDRFLLEQLAGDELTDYHSAFATQKALPAEVVEGLEATGFLRCASDTSRPDFVTIKNAPGYYFQTLDDTVKIVATATMGLTMQCAKCHAHKFDPIPHRDYYRMQAVFMGAYRPSQWVPQVQRRLTEATAHQLAEADRHNAALDAEAGALRQRRAAVVEPLAKRLADERLAALPAEIRDDVRASLATPAAKRTEVQKYLAAKFQPSVQPAGPALEQALAARFAREYEAAKAIDRSLADSRTRRKTFAEIRALYDLPGAVPTKVLRRGDYLNPGVEVRPGAPEMLAAAGPFVWEAPAKDARSSGRRLAFARWLTRPGHPLTARVVANRLWLHHFGEGIVSTPENFGRSGATPSHPELLDWLAVELVEGGWSLKHLHRLIVSSRAYRQASALDEARHAAALKADPEGRLLWRQRLRRLEAEAMRDSLLSASGALDGQMFGPPVGVARTGEGEVVALGDRRSLYLQVRRSQPVTLLQAFDQPVIETNCTRRVVSTVSSQALTMLNSDFVVARAEALAARAARERPASPAGRAVELALSRPATARETAAFADFLSRQAKRYQGQDAAARALADLCHALLSSNEFAYVD